MSPATITYILTRRDKAQLFFYAYYTYPRWGWPRSIAGPAVAVTGAFLVAGNDGWLRVLGGVFIGYGIYYSLKPVLHFLMTRNKQVDSRETISYSEKEQTLRFSSNQVSLEIPVSDVLGLKKTPFGKSILIRVQGRLSRIFIPKPRVVKGNYEKFTSSMEELMRKKREKKGGV